jgi:ABC-type polysaccharide/polyol phosphate export permease
VTFLALLALLLPITLAIRGTVDVALLLLPLILACLFAFVLGFALAVSILHAYFRDVAPILSAALLPWFFVSPIFFRPESIAHEPAARFALEWVNPIAPFIGAVRDVVYGGSVPGLAELLYVVLAAALMLLGGSALFRRLQGELAVVV